MNIPFINLQKQYELYKTAIDSAVMRVLNHGQYIMGPEVSELEQKLANYINVKHALCCSSGTDALILPLMAKNLSKEDAIFTSPFTFFATAEAITLAGGTPVFVDIDPLTYNLDPESLELQIEKTLATGDLNIAGVLPVDLFGIAADYNRINEIANKYELFVLEDAAQSFGAKYGDKKACGLAEVASTSFYPAKPLGCYGDGGAVFTNDTELYEKMLSLRVHGQSLSGDKYDNIQIGMNARMDTIQASILLEKLKFYDEEIERRNLVASMYSERLSEYVHCPTVPHNQSSVWAQYSIEINDRDGLKQRLSKAGIPSAVFYPIPVHLSTAYRDLGYVHGDFSVCESVSKRIVSLPMHPYLDEKEIDMICTQIRGFVF